MSKKSPQRKTRRQRISNAGGPWLRIADAAGISLFSEKHLQRAIRSGTLRAYRSTGGREIRIRRDDLDSWLRGEPTTAA